VRRHIWSTVFRGTQKVRKHYICACAACTQNDDWYIYICIYVYGPIETGDDDKLITIVLIRVLFSVSVTLSFIMTVENSVAILLYYIISLIRELKRFAPTAFRQGMILPCWCLDGMSFRIFFFRRSSIGNCRLLDYIILSLCVSNEAYYSEIPL
jgi:hypothetical protein